ncbi:MAG: twin-arginine translocase subunit TatC [Candidatus Krumholzibacteriota bacterium]|nr:twin-arginine translocase subunit TatC [Candidatus Krumholzibacteriota bacterium]
MAGRHDGDTEKLPEMGFLDHLEELRSALIACLVSWVAASIVLWFLSRHILDFLLAGLPLDSLYFHAPVEAFMTRLKLSFVLGFLAAFPYILFRVWFFVAPGLFSRERRFVVPLVVASTALFYVGVVFAYWVLIPVVLAFLLKFGTESLLPLISIGAYFGFVARLCFAFGIVFQLPIVILFLVQMGAVSARALLRQWRWAIIAIFVVGALLTPPDPVSQLLMALPLVALFLGSALLALLIERRRERAEAAADADGGQADEM